MLFRSFFTFLLVLLFILPLPGLAAQDVDKKDSELRTEQLLEVQSALNEAQGKLKVTQQASAKTTQEKDPGLFSDLTKQNEEVENLTRSLEKIASGGLTIQGINAEEPAFDWRQEMVGITQPLIESLKKITNKPRERAELRATIQRIESQQQLLQKGLVSIFRETEAVQDPGLKKSMQALQEEWQQQRADLSREKNLTERQLQLLDEDTPGWQELVSETANSFFTGHALTLFMAIVSAVGVWLLFRLLNRRLWNHQSSMRSSPLYRFLMYSFHILSTFFIVFTVFVVFYLRDDILLLGVAIIMLIGALIGLQRTLPRFLREVNLLLNLGSAREGERVMYNGVPYRVQSLNVFTTLENPALGGMQRLPLEQVGSLYSRQTLPDEIWFPSQEGDVLLFKDGTLVTVVQQNIEQVILKTPGGSLIHYSTASFYGLNLENLSRNETFTVATVFGLDYRYQKHILDEYPALIRAEIPQTLMDAGIEAALCKGVGVDFKLANASSLDLQIWASFDSQLAASYKRLERILQQACVRVCNRHGLNIPFPQLSVHMESAQA
uniref:N-terminal domain of peptidoglycan hydrolase CwlO-containing protein n=1 Tax=uncultured Thiotrichaceae bacterium TaxID=298394 RepID=A0A6S6TT82_9GAMM|nr:MAG: N-terminal domain of peptidoglycan hydrolase CwlO-containing protein [uncultured Thiotrichaceae bacterium]